MDAFFKILAESVHSSTDIIWECSKVDCILNVVISLDNVTEIEAHRQQLYSQRRRCALLEEDHKSAT